MPSWEVFSQNHELSQILELKKPTREQLLQTQLSILKSTNFLQKHIQLENKEKQEFSINFNMDKIWDNWFEESKKETYSKPEIQVKPKELNEKGKLQHYGNLSNLAYSEFKTVQNKQEKENTPNLQITWIKLDPLNYPNIKKIFTTKKPDNLNPDEEFLHQYVNNPNNRIKLLLDNNPTSVAWDVQDIMRLAWFQNNMNNNNWKTRLAFNENWITNDFWSGISVWKKFENKDKNNPILQNERLLQDWLEELRKEKIKENWNILESINWDFEILDYYPNETKNDKANSWFWAICLKDKTTWEKIFAIRWTKMLDWWDLRADWKLMIWKIPEDQTKDMIDFVERNITKWEKFSITWHSLGWALSQILSAMYKDNYRETYTFNSPGAKNLDVPTNSSDLYQEKFQDFAKNRNYDTIWKNIINVKAAAWLSMIANLWEDIWDNEVLLKNLWSHWIKDLIRYVDKLEEGSEELKRHKKKYNNSEQIINNSEGLK